MKHTYNMNPQRIASAFSLFIIISLAVFQPFHTYATDNTIWHRSNAQVMNTSGERLVFPEKFIAYHLDYNAFFSLLANAPKERSVSYKSGLQVFFPMPDGSLQLFSVVETQVMHPTLANKYPQIKTYIAVGMEDSFTWMRLDFGNHGFHAMISSPRGFAFIDPVNNTEHENYLCYYKSDMPNAFERYCSYGEIENLKKELGLPTSDHFNKIKDTGDELRIYRLAMACTGEYAATKGGTVAGALSGIVTSVNRVNGIYETEVAVRMELIANTDTLIFLNSTSDPYTNNSGSAMLAQNQNTITSRIGSSNYDFGHVFSTGGGGIAGLGVICNSSDKARGVTGLPNPVGDAFDVDYVAHEMGHQFGANHTFNSNSQGSCSGNASMGHNFEPGSGSSIMAYAGICNSHDLQSNSDVLFHTESYNEIFNYTIFGFGNTCPLTIATGNSAPVINALNDFIIPFKTPFTLTGSAYDPDGDSLLYIWEEYDSGPFGSPNTPTGNAAICRDFTPSIDSTRTIPRLSNLLANTSIIGEKLPSYARTMKFKFTARDNKVGGGGVSNNFAPVSINVINTTTPFQITSPNTINSIWHFGSSEVVNWDVSSTNLSPINCSNVSILLSLDGGLTFPYTLNANTPNDGSDTVYVPNNGSIPFLNTTQARIKVQSVGNIFFDICNANFSIQIPTAIGQINNESNQLIIYPNPSDGTFVCQLNSDYAGEMQLNIYDCLGRRVFSNRFEKRFGLFSKELNISSLTKGTYFAEILAGKRMDRVRLIKL